VEQREGLALPSYPRQQRLDLRPSRHQKLLICEESIALFPSQRLTSRQPESG
jgi:hypothetical protein